MKITALFFVLIFSQASFATQNPVAKSIICAAKDYLVTYDVTAMEPFGPPPVGLPPIFVDQLAKSVCKYDGVHQESWGAVCFVQDHLTWGIGSPIQALVIEGYEHGDLFVDKVEGLNCEIKN